MQMCFVLIFEMLVNFISFQLSMVSTTACTEAEAPPTHVTCDKLWLVAEVRLDVIGFVCCLHL